MQNLDPIDVLRDEIRPYRHHFSVDEVDEITLLSIEEAKQLPKDILSIGRWWWLRSPGISQHCAANVRSVGGVGVYGHGVGYGDGAIRPAFRINNLKLPFGEKVTVGKTPCTVVGEGLLLADDIVCKHRFDKKSNVWETSELKRFIESDEFKNML